MEWQTEEEEEEREFLQAVNQSSNHTQSDTDILDIRQCWRKGE